MDILEKPYELTAQLTLSNHYNCDLRFPGIGKSSKGVTIHFNTESEEDISPIVKKLTREHVKGVVAKFLANKERIFQLHIANQNVTYLNSLSGLRDAFRQWDKALSFYAHLKAEILPQMERLRTGNMENRLYQYDADAVSYIKLICNKALNNAKA